MYQVNKLYTFRLHNVVSRLCLRRVGGGYLKYKAIPLLGEARRAVCHFPLHRMRFSFVQNSSERRTDVPNIFLILSLIHSSTFQSLN